MKFLCDEMLGTLAKWLRILGYDTEYAKDMRDEDIIEMAKKEDRIILTRDKGLYSKAQNAVYIENRKLEEQIKKVIDVCKLEIKEDMILTRCTVCNTKVIEVDKDKIRDKIPEHNKFWMCPKCNRIYWIGSHWKNMEKTIKSIGIEMRKKDD